MLSMGSRTNGLLSAVNLSIEEPPDIGDHAGDGAGGGGEGAGEEGASALALPTFKVAIAGGDAVFAGLELIAVHGDAHRAAGFAPVCAGFAEHAIEPLGLGLA